MACQVWAEARIEDPTAEASYRQPTGLFVAASRTARVITDADGMFRLADLSPSLEDVTVFAEGEDGSTAIYALGDPEKQPEDQLIEIRFPGSRAVATGSVVPAVEGVRLDWRGGSAMGSAEVGVDGLFSATGVEAGTVVFEVAIGSNPILQQSVFIPEGGASDLLFDITNAIDVVNARVVLPDGAPSAGMRVRYDDAFYWREATVDVDGLVRLVFPRDMSGRWVSLHLPGGLIADVNLQGELGDILLAMPEAIAMEVHVVDEVLGIPVPVTNLRWRMAFSGREIRSSDGEGVDSPDRDGLLEVPLPLGAIDLTADASPDYVPAELTVDTREYQRSATRVIPVLMRKAR